MVIGCRRQENLPSIRLLIAEENFQTEEDYKEKALVSKTYGRRKGEGQIQKKIQPVISCRPLYGFYYFLKFFGFGI